MRHRLLGILVCGLLFLFLLSVPLNAEVCSNTWTSPGYVYQKTAIWQQSLPLSCAATCVRITITLQVYNYNDVGTLDLFASNTSTIDYGSAFTVTSKIGWIGRINVPVSDSSPGWKTISFPLRLPHLEWLNDDGQIYFALEGPEYLSGSGAQFRVASSTIEKMPLETPICTVGGGSYTSIQSAYNAAADGDTIRCGEAVFEEDLAVNKNIAVTLAGGFDSAFTSNTGRMTTLKGMISTTKGKVTVSNFTLANEFAWSGCPLGFYESFTDGVDNNWLRTAAFSVGGGVYKMTGTNPAQNLLQYAYYNHVYDDFSFQASVKQVQGYQGGGRGIIFRGSSDFSSYYAFLIDATGDYTIIKKVNGVSTALVPWTWGNFITGYNVWNTLGVSCTGSTLKFFNNGGLLKTITDTSISAGVVGIMASDFTGYVNIFHFDDALLEEK